ncbi:ficolin-1 [Plakobranchus ocellatus]|uniref:Ficolin-1 n=1 Tax=Plakobranchus ocellatus TaxID=259542 RepID=A0AAV4CBU6_9GAST|nr:ficolin-1 [Plakobranchus ocellatus]
MKTSLLEIILLCTIGLELTTNTYGLEFTLNRELFASGTDDACGQVICRAKGNHVEVDSVKLMKQTKVGKVTDLAQVSKQRPAQDVLLDGIHGKATLDKNVANINVKLMEIPLCDHDFFLCEVIYNNHSYQGDIASAIVGPGPISGVRSVADVPQKLQECTLSTSPSSGLYLKELEYLGDKVNKLEDRCYSQGDRLDQKFTQKIVYVESKVRSQEDAFLARIGTLEDTLTARVTKLEDRLSSTALKQTTDMTNADMGKAIEELESKMSQVFARFDTVNSSQTEPALNQNLICERGMGNDVTKNLQPYLVMTNQMLQKEILCDTHTDGGGWIIIQRRARGDVDFYRDWTSYREGFGSLTEDFWLGNEAIHRLTDASSNLLPQHPYELRVNIRFKGAEQFAEYSSFRLESETNK